MDPAVVTRFRAQLEEERDDLVRQLKDLGVSPETGAPQDSDFEHGFADSGAATAEKSHVLSVAEALLETSREVKEALQRIEEGRYGVCEMCGEDIPVERLEARPQARLCMKCKQRSR